MSKKIKKPMYNSRRETIMGQLDRITELRSNGYTLTEIAKILGVARSTFFDYKAKEEELQMALNLGEVMLAHKIEASLYKKAMGDYEQKRVRREIDGEGNVIKITEDITGGIPDNTAMIFALKNIMPEKFRERQEIAVDGKEEYIESINNLVKVINEDETK